MLITTDAILPSNRAAYWRDAVRDKFVALDCHMPEPGRFRGSVDNRNAGGLAFALVEADAQTVTRTSALAARSSEDVLLLSLMLRGEACVSQDGRDARVLPGDMVLKDTTRPYAMGFDAPFAKWVVTVSRRALQRRLGGAEALTATCVSGATPLGKLARDFLIGFAALPSSTSVSVQNRLAEQALDLVAIALGEYAQTTPGRSAHLTMLAVRMRNFVEQNLERVELDCALIAAAFRMSPRAVRDVFATDGTAPGRYIMARRLARARDLLVDPAQRGRAIGDIAYASGFSDLSHFSRSFRAAFGCSASDTKRLACIIDQ